MYFANSPHVGFLSRDISDPISYSLFSNLVSHANFTWVSTFRRENVIFPTSIKLFTEKYLSNFANQLSTASMSTFPSKFGMSKFTYTLKGVIPWNGVLDPEGCWFYRSSINWLNISSRCLFKASSTNFFIALSDIFNRVHLKGGYFDKSYVPNPNIL